MGWAVGDDRDHDRFRGYGVPAFCDAKGCGKVIDRGLAYLCDGTTCERDYVDDEDARGCMDLDELEKPALFVCGDHTCADVDEDDLPPEHPDWVTHLLADESWEQWRVANPAKVEKLKGAA